MSQFRKKPVVIEAFRLGMDPWPEWAWQLVTVNKIIIEGPYNHVTHARIDTLEGQMLATRGDYVIRGVKGEVYPCKPDIFAATYEPADSPEAARPAQGTTHNMAECECGWKKCAAEYANNADFYRGIVVQIGEMFGAEARTADDGTVGDSVLALKVPELVAQALQSAPVLPPALTRESLEQAVREALDDQMRESLWTLLDATRWAIDADRQREKAVRVIADALFPKLAPVLAAPATWQPIATLPDGVTEFLGCYKSGYVGRIKRGKHFEFLNEAGYGAGEITHWQPLPAPSSGARERGADEEAGMKMRVEALEPVDITKSPCWQAWQQGKIIGRQEAIDQCIAALPPAKGMPGVGPGWWSERPTGYNQARADAIKALEALRDQPGARGAGD